MKYFKIEEFESPDLKGSGEKMSKKFLTMIDNARGFAGISFKINSGFRTAAHNKKVGGVADSSHLKGVAADIHCVDGQSRFKIVEALRKAGFKRIGIAKTFIHCDCDEGKPQEVIFLY